MAAVFNQGSLAKNTDSRYQGMGATCQNERSGRAIVYKPVRNFQRREVQEPALSFQLNPGNLGRV